MEIRIEGVRITLTKDQVGLIEKERVKRRKASKSFADILKHFEFKKDKEHPFFLHPYYNWYAEIQDQGAYFVVWMTGEGLKNSSGMPGGWVYYEPKEIETELLAALKRMQD